MLNSSLFARFPFHSQQQMGKETQRQKYYPSSFASASFLRSENETKSKFWVCSVNSLIIYVSHAKVFRFVVSPRRMWKFFMHEFPLLLLFFNEKFFHYIHSIAHQSSFPFISSQCRRLSHDDSFHIFQITEWNDEKKFSMNINCIGAVVCLSSNEKSSTTLIISRWCWAKVQLINSNVKKSLPFACLGELFSLPL